MMSTTITDTFRERIKEKLLERMPHPGIYPTSVPGLRLFRKDIASDQAESCFCKPLVSIPIQGFKLATIDCVESRYGENQCLVACVDIPNMNCLIDAEPGKPFLSLTLDLDQNLIDRLIYESPASTHRKKIIRKEAAVLDVDPVILDAFLRLLDVLDNENEIRILAPMIVREIHYRLLIGPAGNLFRVFKLTEKTHASLLQ